MFQIRRMVHRNAHVPGLHIYSYIYVTNVNNILWGWNINVVVLPCERSFAVIASPERVTNSTSRRTNSML